MCTYCMSTHALFSSYHSIHINKNACQNCSLRWFAYFNHLPTGQCGSTSNGWSNINTPIEPNCLTHHQQVSRCCKMVWPIKLYFFEAKRRDIKVDSSGSNHKGVTYWPILEAAWWFRNIHIRFHSLLETPIWAQILVFPSPRTILYCKPICWIQFYAICQTLACVYLELINILHFAT